jgi:pyridoxamine 5'-phosphate oxidase
MAHPLFRPGAKPPADPLSTFERFLAEAAQTEPERGTAMVLATSTPDGRPAARVVLLKQFDARGFVFYTHHEGRKGRELAADAHAALCFHWASREWQVRAEGAVQRIDDAESDAYFASRPRASQLGAWASRQSEELSSRFTLLRRVATQGARFFGRAVPRPPTWGGYRLSPLALEFWQGRSNRLHDRWLYQRVDLASPWSVRRLYP